MSAAAPNNDIANWGRTGRNVSDMVKNASGIWVPARYSSYGEQYTQSVFPDKKVLCDEGSYFTITNPTPGTSVQRGGVGGDVAFSDTVALFVIKNNAPFGSIARTHLDRIRLILAGTAPTATTSMQWAIKIDNINRMPSAGARLAAGAPLSGNNMDSTPTSPNTLIWEFSGATDMAVPASSANARLVARWSHATGLGVSGDEYITVFGGLDPSARSPLTAVRATDVGKMVAVAPPVTIGPQQYAVIYMWWLTAATTATSFEYEVSVVERER